VARICNDAANRRSTTARIAAFIGQTGGKAAQRADDDGYST
jgi:hypothetical protein